jgi:hypothetical protein
MYYNVGVVALILIIISIVFTCKGLKYREVFGRYSFDVDHILLNKDYKRPVTAVFLHFCKCCMKHYSVYSILMKQVFVVFTLFLFTSCNSNNVSSHESGTIPGPTAPDTLADTTVAQKPINDTDSTFFKINNQFPWMGDTIRSYIQLSTNEMVKSFIKDSSIVFMYDGLENTDTGGYVRVRLGADVYNGEGVIFSTAEWIYIDTLSREIFEYDIAADSSHLWIRPQ